MNAFDVLDELSLKTDLVLFGRKATFFPMKAGPGGVNDAAVADADPDRPTLEAVQVIRSEWSERVQIGGQGMPTPTGAFRLAAAGVKHVATVMPKLMGWKPIKGDHLEYEDRPGQRYRITEPMPDGGAGLHLGLSKV